MDPPSAKQAKRAILANAAFQQKELRRKTRIKESGLVKLNYYRFIFDKLKKPYDETIGSGVPRFSTFFANYMKHFFEDTNRRNFKYHLNGYILSLLFEDQIESDTFLELFHFFSKNYFVVYPLKSFEHIAIFHPKTLATQDTQKTQKTIDIKSRYNLMNNDGLNIKLVKGINFSATNKDELEIDSNKMIFRLENPNPSGILPTTVSFSNNDTSAMEVSQGSTGTHNYLTIDGLEMLVLLKDGINHIIFDNNHLQSEYYDGDRSIICFTSPEIVNFLFEKRRLSLPTRNKQPRSRNNYNQRGRSINRNFNNRNRSNRSRSSTRNNRSRHNNNNNNNNNRLRASRRNNNNRLRASRRNNRRRNNRINSDISTWNLNVPVCDVPGGPGSLKSKCIEVYLESEYRIDDKIIKLKKNSITPWVYMEIKHYIALYEICEKKNSIEAPGYKDWFLYVHVPINNFFLRDNDKSYGTAVLEIKFKSTKKENLKKLPPTITQDQFAQMGR